MKFFNAKFELADVNYLSEPSQFTLSGKVVDNSGMFFATDAKIGDIIYLNGSFLGEVLLRYKIIEITEASGVNLTVNVQWDMPEEVVAPLPYTEGIIGAKIDSSELSMITSIFTNGADELLVSAARSYEQLLMVGETKTNITNVESKIKIPTIGYSIL